MVKLQVLIIFLGLILFNYQNCSVNQNSPWSANGTGVVSGTTSTAFGSGAVSSTTRFGQQSISKVNFYDSSNDVRPNGKVNEVSQQYMVDLSNGHVQQLDSSEQFVKEFCLDDSLKNELQSILYSSTVCKNTTPIPDGMVCAEIFKMPYAEVVTNNEVYALGSASNACGTNAVDLCGDYPQMLKGWFQAVKVKIDQLSCQ